MGCSSSKANAADTEAGSPETQPLTVQEAEDASRAVPKLRKALSLGDVDNPEEPVKETPEAETDRTMMLELSIDELAKLVSANGAPTGRRFSISSETDSLKPEEVESFANKQTKLEGDHYDVKANGIGYACKKGLKPEAPNQDSFLVLKVGDDCCLYGVFDGHGRQGHDVSNFIKDHFPKALFSQPNFKTSPLRAMKMAFQKTQSLIEKATVAKTLDAKRSGSTASVVLHSLTTNQLYIAHVGDSRIVLAKEVVNEKGEASVQPLDLTVDHKPNLPEERARIESAGGVVVYDGCYNHRVYARQRDKSGKAYPGLNMSRSLGDLAGFHDAGISATPDVTERQIVDEEESEDEATASKPAGTNSPDVRTYQIDRGVDKFLLLCSDGVWEFLNSDAAINHVNPFPYGEAQAAAETLAAKAWERWIEEFEGEVVDDITALVVHLQGRPDIPGSPRSPKSPKARKQNFEIQPSELAKQQFAEVCTGERTDPAVVAEQPVEPAPEPFCDDDDDANFLKVEEREQERVPHCGPIPCICIAK